MKTTIQVDLAGNKAVINSTAVFSACRKYRYSLHRTWDRENRKCMFIGLNPSIADEVVDDPTIRRCIRYAKEWGYGGPV